jgi:hypothetical protein
MKKRIVLLLFSVLPWAVIAQTGKKALPNAVGTIWATPPNGNVEELNSLQGVWIVEPYLSSFDKTKSAIQSKLAFSSDFPVGLRINSSEIYDGKLNVGASWLHDHLIRPEVSRYMVAGKDTIREQNCFDLHLDKDSANYYLVSDIFYFNYNGKVRCKAYLTWKFGADTSLILYRPAAEKFSESRLVYKRITNQFNEEHPYPNPLYYYTRTKTLTGTYTLKDSLNKTVATNFTIHPSGKTTGYTPLENRTFYFSTDIYCGPPETEDIILVCTSKENFDPSCEVYIYDNVNDNLIRFYSYKMGGEHGIERERVKVMYTLIRN